jgi:predicted  nucleic acid-binding Zn-ribbon protein
MSETNRRIRDLTESRAALERRLGELSEENDRLRGARDDLFAAHKDERDVRQRLDALVKEAKDIIGQVASHTPQIVNEAIRRRAETWAQTAARLLGQGRS